MSDLSQDEKQELMFLRIEKAVSDGVEKALAKHVEHSHEPLEHAVKNIRAKVDSHSKQIWTAGGAIAVFLAFWEFAFKSR